MHLLNRYLFEHILWYMNTNVLDSSSDKLQGFFTKKQKKKISWDFEIQFKHRSQFLCGENKLDNYFFYLKFYVIVQCTIT